MQFTLLDDASDPFASRSRLYRDPCAVLRCTAPEQVRPLLSQAEAYLAQGWYAIWLGRYELAGVLHQVPMHKSSDPLFEILFYRSYQSLDKSGVEIFLSNLIAEEGMDRGPAAEDGGENGEEAVAGVADIRSACTQQQFENSLAQLQNYLAQGHSYQINFTYRLFFQTYGSAVALYRRLRARQPVAYGALIKLNDGWVLSFSPELFIRRSAEQLTTKPMKGTAVRSGLADLSESQALADDKKNRTENLIIVDLLRNDLGRISAVGSVKVPKLFEVEAHPTVWQMTSTICSSTRPQLDLYTLLLALFPCGSVTGAPKRRSLEIISELEISPRRLYCGALGWIDPPPLIDPLKHGAENQVEQNQCRAKVIEPEILGDFCFSVPIRTLLIDTEGNGELGIGAGITYDSKAEDEYAECQLKAKFLTDLSSQCGLIETVFLDEIDGYQYLALHLQRLKNSAKALGLPYSEKKIEASLQSAREKALHTDFNDNMAWAAPQLKRCWRVRLVLGTFGEVDVQFAPLVAIDLPVKVFWAQHTVNSNNYLLRHKTTYRPFYDAAWQVAERLGGFDALFCNERGEVTEGGRSNLFAQINGQWVTPPVSCGLLPGVMRAQLLRQLNANEDVLKRSDICAAQALIVCNSLRGAMPAVLLETEEI